MGFVMLGIFISEHLAEIETFVQTVYFCVRYNNMNIIILIRTSLCVKTLYFHQIDLFRFV